ncbi:MAG: hypothetical protein AUH11_08135 [Acidobacteria bacterium 13_2_20CM_57_17]|nr:MAG: hypothetical protein AUH11_08135 [Acidobacteria bacterium 13_2_20CM_57_17]OLB92510.1 MAG: hypothetical protein AUI02_08120 [Acidobacteria bacterium 13_2_20CM_2_57_12]
MGKTWNPVGQNMSKSARSKTPVTKAKQKAKDFTKRISIVDEIRLKAKNEGLDRMTMGDIIREIKRYRRERRKKLENR